MRIRHLRNATFVLTLGEHRILVDPMLSEPGALQGFKLFGGGRSRNPLVPLPDATPSLLEGITAVLVTHEHPDHLDPPAIRWIKKRSLPVWTSPVDTPNLTKKGLDARPLVNGALDLATELVPARHGRGIVAWLMGPVAGFYLAHPDEPSLLITSDATLSPDLAAAIERLKPGVIIAPAGAANFGVGPDLLFSIDELVELVRLAPDRVVFNHLEALDHCPTTRHELRQRMESEGLADRVGIPEDSECIRIDATPGAIHAQPAAEPSRSPGLQKWLTAFFTGT